ncbi:uncharacterized protein LOC124167840 [Ischnura elegans]|uniref:uncharacterized protein LOC124167840 n=1 Tax=Ischnura elegans TaxID=197161 RepID=UPI001ED88EB0|nr:uncharacterized protein LOC124167840 [Ischnura elegans]
MSEPSMKGEISIMVISPIIYGDPLIKAIYDQNTELGNSYNVNICSCQCLENEPSLLDDLNSGEAGQFKFDFIVLVMDSRLRDSVMKAEENISHIPNFYLTCKRIAFVSGVARMTEHNAWDLRRKYNCPALVGNILDPKACECLARRILKLVEFTLGSATGLPNITYKETYEDLGNKSCLNK